MSEQNNGGTAFPTYADNAWNKPYSPDKGMTLRDYFAAMAMQAIVSTVPHLKTVAVADVADEAYEYADAMLKERAK